MFCEFDTNRCCFASLVVGPSGFAASRVCALETNKLCAIFGRKSVYSVWQIGHVEFVKAVIGGGFGSSLKQIARSLCSTTLWLANLAILEKMISFWTKLVKSICRLGLSISLCSENKLIAFLFTSFPVSDYLLAARFFAIGLLLFS
ncbi:hypothetical protein BB561_003035 [Smittium simulii]|uniref:Uncharacterized protein n=1 Tax=Smittium simulii TaxID=133385 RepID=A0A2T9YN87_9FUNG|nr:hypothetical protein BB561_003035 [Smittium simulii]